MALVTSRKANRLAVIIWLLALAVLSIGNLLSPQAAWQPVLASPEIGEKQVRAKLIADTSSIRPAASFRLGVVLDMAPGWHTYYKESGDAGMPTRIDWQLPAGFQAQPLQWQRPETFQESGIVTYGYQGQTVIAAQITAPPNLAAGKNLTLGAKVRWLSCKEVCIPGGADLTISMPVASADKPPHPDNSGLFARVGFAGDIGPGAGVQAPASDQPGQSILDGQLHIEGSAERPLSLSVYLGLAFVGGFILNFMPCVLPVISLKVLGFVEQAGEDPRRVFHHGLAFTAGILASFLGLAFLVIAIQQAGQSVGWGFQFQHPGFLVAMSTVVVLLALSLFGVFYITAPGGQSLARLAGRGGQLGSFFNGVLATILATPCTAPFLGTALGFAFTQRWWTTLAIFLTVGLGMSAPYLLITARPGWMRYLPRPGEWMVAFKESMGFLLIATVIWLLWVLSKQVGVDAAFWTASFLLAVALAGWLVGRLINLTSTPRRRYTVWLIALAVVGASYYLFIASVPGLIAGQGTQADKRAGAGTIDQAASASGLAWQPFTVETLDRALSAGKIVFLDFTAEWCLTCKVNEQTVINSDAVSRRLKSLQVVTLKADWTRQDPLITKLLNKFGRSGVPLYVIFAPGRSAYPIVLPEVITQPIVLQALDQAALSQHRAARALPAAPGPGGE